MLQTPILHGAVRYIDPFQANEIRRLVREFGSPLLIVDCERVRAAVPQAPQGAARVWTCTTR